MATTIELNGRGIWVRSQLEADQWRSASMWNGRMGHPVAPAEPTRWLDLGPRSRGPSTVNAAGAGATSRLSGSGRDGRRARSSRGRCRSRSGG